MDRKRELKQQYRHMRPEMGLFVVRSNVDRTCYIEATQDLKGTMNSTKFKLRLGSHPNLALQKAWNAQGEASFAIEVLETLEYDQDESKADYADELAVLCTMWEEKLAGDNVTFYVK